MNTHFCETPNIRDYKLLLQSIFRNNANILFLLLLMEIYIVIVKISTFTFYELGQFLPSHKF